MNVADIIRVARQQATLATRGLDQFGIIALYLEEIPIHVSERKVRTRCGFFCGQGDDVGRIVIHLSLNPTEKVFTDTLYHELAHAIAQWLWGASPEGVGAPHGEKWKSIMKQLGRPNATRYT